jgi:hypothetical protein
VEQFLRHEILDEPSIAAIINRRHDVYREFHQRPGGLLSSADGAANKSR